MGITSCVIAVIAIISVVLMVIVLSGMTLSNVMPNDELSPIYYVIGGWIFGTGVASLTGIVFGIGGLLQKDRRRHWAIIGLIANVLIPIGLMTFLVVATTFQNSTPGQTHQPLSVDPDGWHSPTTRYLALLFVVLSAALAVRLWKRKSLAAAPPPTTSCGMCRKIIPLTSRFCRRCGHALHAR